MAPTKPPSSGGSRALPVAAFVVIAVALLAFVFFRPSEPIPEAPTAPPAEPARAETPKEPAGVPAPAAEPAPLAKPDGPLADRQLPPLPLAGYPPPRPPEIVRAVYRFAAEHGDVLQYVPCFCGCERNGHQANDDCFVASRDAEGRVTWDAHGMGWSICIDIARVAMQMHASGASTADIRAAVERQYRPMYPTMTLTPMPR